MLEDQEILITVVGEGRRSWVWGWRTERNVWAEGGVTRMTWGTPAPRAVEVTKKEEKP